MALSWPSHRATKGLKYVYGFRLDRRMSTEMKTTVASDTGIVVSNFPHL